MARWNLASRPTAISPLARAAMTEGTMRSSPRRTTDARPSWTIAQAEFVVPRSIPRTMLGSTIGGGVYPNEKLGRSGMGVWVGEWLGCLVRRCLVVRGVRWPRCGFGGPLWVAPILRHVLAADHRSTERTPVGGCGTRVGTTHSVPIPQRGTPLGGRGGW